MSIYLVNLSSVEFTHRLFDALAIYTQAMNYPPDSAPQRASLWIEHSQRPGWQAIAAFTHNNSDIESGDHTREYTLAHSTMIGIAYGYSGAPNQWWGRQVRLGLHQSGCSEEQISSTLAHYFELTELHVTPAAQGQGLGQALLSALLANRAESSVLLSTPEIVGESNRAWQLYRRMGFSDLIRNFQFDGDSRPFAVLSHRLPL